MGRGGESGDRFSTRRSLGFVTAPCHESVKFGYLSHHISLRSILTI